MRIQRPWLVPLLLIVLGIALLWTGGTIAGPEDEVNQYTAYEVTHDDDELVLTNSDTGEEERGSSVAMRNVDESVICLPAFTRECELAYREYEGIINATSSYPGEFGFAYLDGEFYQFSRPPGSDLEFERTEPSEAFERIADDNDRLTETEREVLDEGKIATTRSVRTNRLLKDDGDYYTILHTAGKHYGDGVTTCGSSGGGFCNRADRVRWTDWISDVGYGVLGAIGVLVGVGALVRQYRSEQQNE